MLCAGLGASLLTWAAQASAQPEPPPAEPPPAEPPPAEPPPAEASPPPAGPADVSAGPGAGDAAPTGPSAPPPAASVETPAEEVERPPSLGLPPGDKRPEQDYDGRGDRPTSTGEALLWIPRVTFFPVYLATEYLLRKPLGAITVAAERGEWVQEIKDFFTFGPDNNIGVVPTAFLDFGFHPSVGVYFFYNDFLAEGNDLRANAAFGGQEWLKLVVADRVQLDEDSHIKFEARAFNRPDLLYWGIGPDVRSEDESTYEIGFAGGEVLFFTELNAGTFIEVYASGDWVRFDNVECETLHTTLLGDGTVDFACDDPGLEAMAALGTYEVPPGFDTGYAAFRQGGRVALDSRDRRPAPGTGVAAEVKAEHAFDLESADVGRWVKYGGGIAGFVDITGRQRVISLSLTTEFADPLTDDYEIPFTELVGNAVGSESGTEIMRGFRPGRLIGRSAIVGKLEYEYPIWAFLDGSLQVATGNAFGEHLDGFDLEKLRMSFAGGIRSISHRDHSFNFLIGTGTDTFAAGAGLTELRLLIGGTTGF